MSECVLDKDVYQTCDVYNEGNEDRSALITCLLVKHCIWCLGCLRVATD